MNADLRDCLGKEREVGVVSSAQDGSLEIAEGIARFTTNALVATQIIEEFLEVCMTRWLRRESNRCGRGMADLSVELFAEPLVARDDSAVEVDIEVVVPATANLNRRLEIAAQKRVDCALEFVGILVMRQRMASTAPRVVRAAVH